MFRVYLLDPFVGIQGKEVFADHSMKGTISDVCTTDVVSFNTALTTITPDYLIKFEAHALTLDYLLN